MTAEDDLPEKRERSLVPWVAAAVLIITVLAAIGGWLLTVRELNRHAAHQVVSAEALRLARPAQAGEGSASEPGVKR